MRSTQIALWVICHPGDSGRISAQRTNTDGPEIWGQIHQRTRTIIKHQRVNNGTKRMLALLSSLLQAFGLGKKTKANG